jgi:hypothetical protein
VRLERVFRYRVLLAKCELRLGLDWDEIEELANLERAFAPRETGRGRRFRREAVALEGIVRGTQLNDRVAITELGAGGLVCRHAPFIARGEQVEIVIDKGGRSYRFRAEGVWLKDDGDDYKVGLVLVGMPLCLHRHAISRHEVDLVDRIALAAAA